MIKPQIALLKIWRISLVGSTFPIALLISIFMKIGSFRWVIFTSLWILVFLFIYLAYLPLQYKKLAYTLRDEILIMHSGIFSTNIRTMPLHVVQYISIIVLPLDKVFGLASLLVTAPGGVVLLPGLCRKDADTLASLIPLK